MTSGAMPASFILTTSETQGMTVGGGGCTSVVCAAKATPDARQNDTVATLPSLAHRNPCRPVLTNLFIIKPSVLPLRPEWVFVKGCTHIIMDDLDGSSIHSDACKTDANDAVYIAKKCATLDWR